MALDSVQLPIWLLAVLLAAAIALGAALAVLLRSRSRARSTSTAHGCPDPETPGARSGTAEAKVLSHEIRTPLTLVKGAGELLAEETPGPLTAEQRYFVDTIVDNTSLVIGLAEGFLLEARVEGGELQLDRTAVDVRALVRETVLELRRIRRAELRLDSRGEPLVLELDRAMIRQVLWNLVNNAIRHAGPDAHVTVHVDATAEGATIAVADDGPGMDTEQRRDLFAAHTSGHREWTGLGMGVIERIVTAHGGRIVVDTLVQRGTRILVVLPWPHEGAPDA